MKVGDLVKITVGDLKPIVGIIMRDDTLATGEDKDGFPIITRAFVLWSGRVYSTPLDQMEVISESI